MIKENTQDKLAVLISKTIILQELYQLALSLNSVSIQKSKLELALEKKSTHCDELCEIFKVVYIYKYLSEKVINALHLDRLKYNSLIQDTNYKKVIIHCTEHTNNLFKAYKELCKEKCLSSYQREILNLQLRESKFILKKVTST